MILRYDSVVNKKKIKKNYSFVKNIHWFFLLGCTEVGLFQTWHSLQNSYFLSNSHCTFRTKMDQCLNPCQLGGLNFPKNLYLISTDHYTSHRVQSGHYHFGYRMGSMYEFMSIRGINLSTSSWPNATTVYQKKSFTRKLRP